MQCLAYTDVMSLHQYSSWFLHFYIVNTDTVICLYCQTLAEQHDEVKAHATTGYSSVRDMILWQPQTM